jgi:hypothetical protein
MPDAVAGAMPRHPVVDDVSVDRAGPANLTDFNPPICFQIAERSNDRVHMTAEQPRQILLARHDSIVLTHPRNQDVHQ